MDLHVHVERDIEQLLSIARLQVLPDEGVSFNIKTLYSGFAETIELIQSIRKSKY